MTTGPVARVAIAAALSTAAFVVGYTARELDAPFGISLSDVEGDDSIPEPGGRLRFDATAYCKGTTTASGVAVRAGIAAADPALLPVGSVVNVATGDERYTGIYTVLDTGPKVLGRHLDLYIWNCNDALAFGRRGVEVRVMRLGWDPQASAPSLIDRLFRGREARLRARAAARPPVPEATSPLPSSADIGPAPPANGLPFFGVAPVDPSPEPAPADYPPPPPNATPAAHPGAPTPALSPTGR